jgi:predicted dienelactone hydrolase
VPWRRPQTCVIACAALLGLAAPVPAEARDPGAPGPFTVGHTTLSLSDATRARPLLTDVWYPTAPAARRFPLVLVAHGNCGSRTNYRFLTAHVASHGFVVAAPDFPGLTRTDCQNGASRGDFPSGPPLDLVFLHTTLHDRDGPAATIARAVGGRRTGLIGHSLGGLAVLEAALRDAHLRAVVALAPAAAASLGVELSASRPRRPILVVGGGADDTVPFTVTTRFFAALEAPAVLVGIAGGTHAGFTDVDPRATAEGLARQHDLVRRYTTAFLVRHVVRARRFAHVLTPRDATTVGADVTLHLAPRLGGRPFSAPGLGKTVRAVE